MVSFIRNVSFDCPDPYVLAHFWSEVVGHPVDPDFVRGDTEVVIEPPGRPRLFFQAVPEGNAANQNRFNCPSWGGLAFPSWSVEQLADGWAHLLRCLLH
ncbi:VOC family protein [Micromonospora sp. NPDC005806]|uniref:VOC family protein n=1 Tax=Micromonospora sp. NPDC005806 TaxID=3364234 RepID=UPI0036CB12FC